MTRASRPGGGRLPPIPVELGRVGLRDLAITRVNSVLDFSRPRPASTPGPRQGGRVDLSERTPSRMIPVPNLRLSPTVLREDGRPWSVRGPSAGGAERWVTRGIRNLLMEECALTHE